MNGDHLSTKDPMKELLSSLAEKITQFVEIVFVLLLDFGITVALWYFKSKTDELLGFNKMQEEDEAFKIIITFSTYGIYLVLTLYIIGDIFRQALKTYIQIKKQLQEINADL